MSKLKLKPSSNYGDFQVPYVPGSSITLAESRGTVYIVVSSMLKELGVNPSKYTQRLRNSPLVKIGSVVTLSLANSGVKPLIALDVDNLAGWLKADVIDDLDASSAGGKLARSLITHSGKFKTYFGGEEVQLSLELDAAAKSTDKGNMLPMRAVRKLIRETVAPLKQALMYRKREQKRLFKAYITKMDQMPYWTLRDAANMLQVHESELADALIEDGLLIRDGHKLKPGNSSMSERFFFDTNPSSNVQIRPDMCKYLKNVADAHKIPLRNGAVEL